MLWLFVYLSFVAIAGRFLTKSGLRLSWLPAGYALFFFFQVVTVKLLDLVGVLGAGPVVGIYLLAAVPGVLFLVRDGQAGIRRRLYSTRGSGVDRERGERLLQRILAGSVVIIIAGLALYSLLVPTHVWDVQAYHMPMVAGYVQNGSLSLGPTQDLRQIFRVNGGELQMLNLALLSGSDAWMELPNVLALVVSLGTAYVLGRSVLGRKTLAALVVLVTLTAPQVLYGSVTAKNDIVFLALVVGAFYWVVRTVDEPEELLWPALLALTCSLAVATKVIGLNLVGTAGLVLLVLTVARRVPFRSLLVFTLLTLAGVLILVGDVYWSNFTRSEVPVGIRPGEVRFTIGLANLVEALEFYVYDLAFERLVTTQIFEHDFSHYGYLFPFVLVLGAVAGVRQVFVPAERRRSAILLAAMAFVLFVSVIIARLPIQWDQRFMIWMVPVLAILALCMLRNWSPPALLALGAFCSALALFHVVHIFTNGAGGMFEKSAVHLARNGELARLTDVRHEKYDYKIDGFEKLAAAAGPEDSILYIGAEDTWQYPAWGRGFSRTVIGVRDSADVARKLQDQSFDFAVVEADAADPLRRAVRVGAKQQAFTQLYTSANRSIFRRDRLSEPTSTP